MKGQFKEIAPTTEQEKKKAMQDGYGNSNGENKKITEKVEKRCLWKNMNKFYLSLKDDHLVIETQDEK